MNKLKFFIVLLVITSPLSFSQKRAFTIDDIYKVKSVGEPIFSNTADKIAFTVTESNLFEGKTNTEVYLMNSDGSGIENISKNEKSDNSPFWSEDGKTLFYISARNGLSQVYSYSLVSKETKQITDLPVSIGKVILSPDQKMIAFAADIFPECSTDFNCTKELRESTENGPVQAYIADELLFRHWTDYIRETETHIFIYNLETKEYKDLGESEWASDLFLLGGDQRIDFSPDSKEFCMMHNPDSVRAVSTNGDLWTVNLLTGEKTNITSSNKAFDGSPLYSPDGKYIAYRLQDTPGYEASRYKLALYDRAKKETIVLTEKLDNNVEEILWAPDSKSIYFNVEEGGYSPVYSVDISSGKIYQVTGKESIFGFELDQEGNAVYFNGRRIDKPAELFKIDLNSKVVTQLTFFNKQLLEEVDFRPAEQLWVEGADGKKVQVFLVKPHNFDPDKKYPLVLNIHGGPQSQWMDSYRPDWQVYPGAGYLLAFPNPHGSTGFGEDYTKAISGDWGGKVYEDVMKVTDALEKLPYVDKEHIGAMGWSYGGYMMNWIQGKTKRYKCLASMMGIFDLESMWGATEELWFVNWDLKGEPWKSDQYKKFSPSNYVENFSTPALIITGEKDYRVPYTQSIQYFTTLQTLGIDSRLIIFPNDGHWPNSVKSMPVYYNAHLEWFHKYLGGGPAPYDSKEMIKNISFGKKEKAKVD